MIENKIISPIPLPLHHLPWTLPPSIFPLHRSTVLYRELDGQTAVSCFLGGGGKVTFYSGRTHRAVFKKNNKKKLFWHLSVCGGPRRKVHPLPWHQVPSDSQRKRPPGRRPPPETKRKSWTPTFLNNQRENNW